LDLRGPISISREGGEKRKGTRKENEGKEGDKGG